MLYLVVYRNGYQMGYSMPPMTPFEAGMLAKELNKAAERADVSTSASQ